MAKDYRLEKRKFVIGGIALTIVLIYLIRLFVLQITTDDYKKNADSNAFLNKIQYPSRGAIYDRNGKLLVFNQPAYDITLVPKEVENLDTLDLCESLGITRAQFLKIMSDMRDRRRNPGYSHIVLRASIKEVKRNIVIIEAKLYNKDGEVCTEAVCTYFTFSHEKSKDEMHFDKCDVEPEEILPLI